MIIQGHRHARLHEIVRPQVRVGTDVHVVEQGRIPCRPLEQRHDDREIPIGRLRLIRLQFGRIQGLDLVHRQRPVVDTHVIDHPDEVARRFTTTDAHLVIALREFSGYAARHIQLAVDIDTRFAAVIGESDVGPFVQGQGHGPLHDGDAIRRAEIGPHRIRLNPNEVDGICSRVRDLSDDVVCRRPAFAVDPAGEAQLVPVDVEALGIGGSNVIRNAVELQRLAESPISDPLRRARETRIVPVATRVERRRPGALIELPPGDKVRVNLANRHALRCDEEQDDPDKNGSSFVLTHCIPPSNRPIVLNDCIRAGSPQRFLQAARHLRLYTQLPRVCAAAVAVPRRSDFVILSRGQYRISHVLQLSRKGDCFVASFLAMTWASPSCHCERSEAIYNPMISEMR